MAANDTISDMLTRIRNAGLARHKTTNVPATKMTRSIARVLQEEGFIGEFEEQEEGVKKTLVLTFGTLDRYCLSTNANLNLLWQRDRAFANPRHELSPNS